MPIDYTYGSPGILAFAAQRVGAGQAARRDEEREREIALRQQQQAIDTALQVARINQQGQQFNQNLAYNAGRDRRQSNFNAAQLMAGAAQREAEAQREAIAGDIGFQRQIALAQLGQQFQQDNAQQNLQLYQDKSLIDSAAQREDEQFKFGVDGALRVDEQARAMLSEYRKFPLNPQGQQQLGEFSARIRRIQGQRDSLRPGQYAQAMGEVLTEMEQAGIKDFIEQQPTIQSMMEGGQLWKDPDTGDWWGVEFRNGQAVPRQFPNRNKPDTSVKPIDTPFGQLAPEKAVSTKFDVMDRARKELIEEATVPNATGPAKYPDEKAIAERARRLMKMQDELFGGQDGGGGDIPEFASFKEADEAKHVGEFTIQGKQFYRDKEGLVGVAEK